MPMLFNKLWKIPNFITFTVTTERKYLHITYWNRKKSKLYDIDVKKWIDSMFKNIKQSQTLQIKSLTKANWTKHMLVLFYKTWKTPTL